MVPDAGEGHHPGSGFGPPRIPAGKRLGMNRENLTAGSRCHFSRCQMGFGGLWQRGGPGGGLFWAGGGGRGQGAHLLQGSRAFLVGLSHFLKSLLGFRL